MNYYAMFYKRKYGKLTNLFSPMHKGIQNKPSPSTVKPNRNNNENYAYFYVPLNANAIWRVTPLCNYYVTTINIQKGYIEAKFGPRACLYTLIFINYAE